MHLLWGGTPVPAPVAAVGNLLAQWSGWEPVQPLTATPPPDAILLDWGPTPPEPHPTLPLLWLARTDVSVWSDDGRPDLPRRMRRAGAVRPTELVLAHALDEAGPAIPLLGYEEPVTLPGAIELAHTAAGTPVVVGLQPRGGRQPAVYVGSDLGTLLVRALGAGRDRALALAGHPVAGLYARTGEPEHLVKFPWANHGLSALRWCCDWLAREAGIPRVAAARYPEGKTWALALSHDVDVARRTPVHLLKQVRHAGRRAALALAQRAPGRAIAAIADGVRAGARADFWAVEECQAADEALGVRSSFYFYSKSARTNGLMSRLYDPDYGLSDGRVRGSSAYLIDHGCEVGLHGSYLSHRDAALLAAEREALEHCIGQSVGGVRQHFLQGEAPEVWRVQAAAGLTYDTSWSYRDRTGFRSGLALPYHPWDEEEEASLALWELPLVLMDGQLYDRECSTSQQVQSTLDGVLDQLRLSGGAGAADWHQRFFADPAHPWRLTYERMVQRARAGGAWLGPCGALVEWWRSRAALRWTVRRDGAAWQWRIDAPEPLAGLAFTVAGVRPDRVDFAGGAPVETRREGDALEFTIGELGPERPLEFRAEPAAA